MNLKALFSLELVILFVIIYFTQLFSISISFQVNIYFYLLYLVLFLFLFNLSITFLLFWHLFLLFSLLFEINTWKLCYNNHLARRYYFGHDQNLAPLLGKCYNKICSVDILPKRETSLGDLWDEFEQPPSLIVS